jgi:SnoaL-like protein
MAIHTMRDLIMKAYEGFNARDLAGVLTLMHPEVDWPNGMEGGRVHGHEGVRDYWTRQWAMIDPHVEPRRIQIEGDEASGNGQVVVDVHQFVRDLAGTVLLDQMVQHVYRVEGGLITRMDIVDVPQPQAV